MANMNINIHKVTDIKVEYRERDTYNLTRVEVLDKEGNKTTFDFFSDTGNDNIRIDVVEDSIPPKCRV